MRTVAIVTQARSDYGIYLPLLEAMKGKLETDIIALGATDYFLPHTRISVSFHRGCDWVVVLGDTLPMLKAAIWAAERYTPIAHIQGGDATTGACIDEQIRHAITRFAHLHFPTTQQSADRLVKMGEEAWRIQVVGPLGIYAMPNAQFTPEKELRRNLLLSDKPIAIVLQHPVSTQAEQAGEQMRITLKAISQIPDIQPVVIYPNSESGSEDMIEVIKASGFLLFENLPYLTFQSLLKYSSVIVGNSSCALVEAPFYGIPAVNIGIREDGREHAANLYNVGHDVAEIKKAIGVCMVVSTKTRLMMEPSPFHPEPDGVDKIIKALIETPIGDRLMMKRLTY